MRIPHKLLLVLEVAVVVSAVILAVWIRSLPWFNADMIIHRSGVFSKLSLREYGFLHGNDPWIEYWITRKLFENGAGYWWSLKPGLDAETSKFWYPWGRDFTRSEYPLLPLFAALTYPLVENSMSLQAWVALVPPIAGGLLVVASYILMRRIYGVYAGVVAALLVAFLPASMDRTMAGFAEKEGFALPILLASLWLLCEALRFSLRGKTMLSVVVSVLGGVVGGVVGFAWGGYRFIPLAAAVAGLLAPLIVRDIDASRRLLVPLIVFIVSSMPVLYASPAHVKGVVLSIAALAASLAGYLLWLAATRLSYAVRVKAVYAYVAGLAALMLVVFYTSITGYLPISARALYALLWPTKGAFKFSPLVESVAEHYPPSLRMLGAELGIVLVLAPIGSLVSLVYSFRRRDPSMSIVPVLALGAYWAMLGMAYFLQLGGVFSALAAASMLAPLARMEEKGKIGRRRRGVKKRYEWFEELKPLVLAVLLLLYIGVSLWGATTGYARLSGAVPSILTGGTDLGLNPAWLVALEVIDREAPRDAVFLPWWDYGYWVTVPTGRATLADGATLNESQIRLLARILTGSEEESTRLLKSLGLKPGKTFILVNEVLVVNTTSGVAEYSPLLLRADIPKSYWMIRIAGRNPDNYFTWFNVRLPDGSIARLYGVDASKNATRKALIYRILVDAAYHLSDRRVCVSDYYPPRIKEVRLGLASWKHEDFNHFKPWRIIAYSFPGLSRGDVKVYLVVAIYEWVG